MKKVNKHGLKMVGLKRTSGSTDNWGYYSGMYAEIFYDQEDGEVWAVFQCSLGQNTYTCYHSPSIIKICNASCHMTMQEIADAIHERIGRS